MSDLIRREDAERYIDNLLQSWCSYANEEYRRGLEDCLEGVQSLPSADRWIPVSERLPETNNGRYLFVRKLYIDCQNEPIYWVSIAWYGKPLMPTQRVKGKCWYIPDDGNDVVIDDVVIAWMPLPEPYEGVTE